MKRIFPVVLGGMMLLLSACSSNNAPPVPSASTTTETKTEKTETKTEKTDSTSDDKADASKSDSDASSTKDDTTASSDSDSSNNARNLYVEQQKSPDSSKGMGIVYWLELNRDGKKSHVTNKMQFHEGDQLRIHVKPNVNCYSYILMVQGSKGDHSVLFPSEDLPDNKLKAGKEMVLPYKKGDEAWLKFDANAGTEIVRVVVSKKKLDPESELPGGESSTVSIASARGDEDSVPDGTAATIVADNSSAKPTRNLTVETTSKHPDEDGQITVVSKAKDKALRVDIAMDHGESNN